MTFKKGTFVSARHRDLKLCAVFASLLFLLMPMAEAVNVACVGDSITYGYGVTQTYPMQLQALFDARDGAGAYTVGNFGINSKTLRNDGDRPYTADSIYPASLASNPDVVVIMLGANDAKIGINWNVLAKDGASTSIDIYNADFATLIESYRTLPSAPKILVCTPVPVSTVHPGTDFGISGTVISDEMAPAIRTTVSAPSDVTLIELNADFPDIVGNYIDKVHPSETGYAFIAEKIYDAIAAPPPTTNDVSTISVNFATAATYDLAATDSAGLAGYAATNWNNLTGWAGYIGSGTDVPLVDDSGALTTAALTYNTHMWNHGASATSPDGTMSASYLNDYSDGTAGAITVTGIPYGTYDVIVYHATDAGTGFDGVTVNGQLQADCAYLSTNDAAVASWPEVGAWVEGENCRVVTNVTGSTLTITTGARDATIRSAVSGIQIVGVSAPPAPPVWTDDTITVEGAVNGILYNGTLFGKATDANGDPITYSLVDVGTWLNVVSNGTMWGTPAIGDVGPNTFTVRATTVDGSVDATLNIEVTEPVVEAVIAWNFAQNTDSRMVQEETADGTDLWTDSIDSASPGNAQAVNSTDPYAVTTPVSASHVTVAWSTGNMWQGGSVSNPEQQLYNKYLDDQAATTVTVSGLTEWLTAQGADAYTVDFYRCTDAGTHFSQVDVYDGTGTNGTLLGSAPYEAADGDGDYPTGSGGNGARSKQTVTNSFSSGTVTFHTAKNLGGTSRAGLSGFKITAIIDDTPGAQVTDLVATGPVADGTGLELSWTGQNGKLYGVETNANLIITAGWGTYMTGIMGDGGTITITNAIGTEGQIFYRIISE